MLTEIFCTLTCLAGADQVRHGRMPGVQEDLKRLYLPQDCRNAITQDATVHRLYLVIPEGGIHVHHLRTAQAAVSSQPQSPDHGARLVTMVLNDPELRGDWAAELEDVRLTMLGLREQLAAELQRLTGSDRFGFLAQHRGMFSRLGATPEQVEAMRESHGIYMVGDSRFNVAGLNKDTVPVLAEAIVKAGV